MPRAATICGPAAKRSGTRSFRGKKAAFPNDRFSATFFQPFYAGQTFGIGQLNPLTALEMSDLVHRVSGLPTLDSSDPRGVYKTIMDPDLTLPYVAATLRKSIDAYKSIAGFDISQNPGLTATLYNLGNPEARARALKAENDRPQEARAGRQAAGRKLLWLAGQRKAAGTAGAVLVEAQPRRLPDPSSIAVKRRDLVLVERGDARRQQVGECRRPG